MQFNDITGKSGIIQNCESLCNLGDGGITNDATLLAKFTGYVNEALNKVVSAILNVDKNWRWDDSNWGSDDNQAIPVATCTLVSGQRSYILPRATNDSNYSTLWKVYRVRLLDTNGQWYDLTPLGADEDELEPIGRPTRYRLLRNTIRLSDIPGTGYVTLTEGMQVWFQREFVRFTTTDTTQQPGILSSFHYLLPLDAAASYLLPFDTNKANEYMVLFKNGLEDMKTAYGNRNDDAKTTRRMMPVVEETR